MAAAVGTETMSIFGPTSPKRLAPNYNEGVSICPDKQIVILVSGIGIPTAPVLSI